MMMQTLILLLLALLSHTTTVTSEATKLKSLRAAHPLDIQWGIIGWNEISGAPIAAAGPQGSEPAPIGSCPAINYQYATTSTHILFNALTLRSVEWVDIHLKTINGESLNYRMTNEEAKIFTYPIPIGNDLLSYSFTYASQGMACDTQEFSATASNPTQPTDETTSAPTTTTTTTTTPPVTSAPTTTTVVTDAPPTSAPSTSIQWCRAGTCTSTPPSGVEVGTWVCSSGTCTYQQVTVLGNARCYVAEECQAS